MTDQESVDQFCQTIADILCGMLSGDVSEPVDENKPSLLQGGTDLDPVSDSAYTYLHDALGTVGPDHLGSIS